jgi:uncharacterized protein (DUF1330 family)
MPKAYWINTFRAVHDPEKLAAYAELAGPIMLAGGGRFLARGMPAAAYELGILERTTVIEFPSVEAAIATYEGADYQAALAGGGGGGGGGLRLIVTTP